MTWGWLEVWGPSVVVGGVRGEEDVNGQRLAGVARGAQHRPLLLTLQVKINCMIVLVVQLFSVLLP